MVYAASKAEGERAAFGWVEKNKPGFVFNSVLPDFAVSSFHQVPLLPSISI
jgi:hypothetical protein